jgi:hypothetical protein
LPPPISSPISFLFFFRVTRACGEVLACWAWAD